jgi:hypothetical protein
MSRFDLNNLADFSRITQQSLGSAIGTIDGSDPREWDLLEGSYDGVVFHVFKSKQEWQGAVARVNDTAGRRKVKYKYPYRDGQTTDDLGRAPGSFQIEMLVHGIRYMKGYSAIMAALNKPTPGVLVHPINGNITVVPEDVQIAHTSEKRKAVLLVVTFIEHNFSVGDIRQLQDSSVKGKLAQALDVFRTIDATINRINNADLFTRAVKNQINALLSSFRLATGEVLTAMNVTFNGGVGSADIPSLLPVNEGGTRQTDGSVTDNNFVVVRSISDPFNNIPASLLSDTTTQALAASEIQKRVVALRVQAAGIITRINAEGGALDFFDDILGIRQSVVFIQGAYEAGIASSNARIIDYTTPRLMTIREVAFANNIPVDRVQEIDLLNPALLSVNYIEKGTILKVPVS